MIKPGLIIPVLIFVMAAGCSKPPVKIAVTDEITVTAPAGSDRVVSDSSVNERHWVLPYDDDLFAIHRYRMSTADSNLTDRIKQFRSNIASFLADYDCRKTDSLFSFSSDILRGDISFDFAHNDEDFRFFSRFIARKDYFVVFCFQTPFPVDRFSKSIKDRLFSAIEIK
jgi:hypothetical protein